MNSFFEGMIRREQNFDKDPRVIEEMCKGSADEVGSRKMEMTLSLEMKLVGRVGVDVLYEVIARLCVKSAVCGSTFPHSDFKTADIIAVVAETTTQVAVDEVIAQVAAHEAVAQRAA